MKYFFITSLGRSGTKFFANMLNHSNEVMCFHEPYREDYLNLPLSYYASDLKILEHNLEARFKDVELKVKANPNSKYYGEVNSLLRYNTTWLRNHLNAKVAHIVRDPKKVVPSIYSRNVYKQGSSHLEIVPKNASAYADKWIKMSRFEKICWYWMHTNKMLLDNVERYFKFEDLISDYSKFQELIRYLEIPMISESIWKAEVSKPKNTSKKAVFRKKLKSILQLKDVQVEQIGNYNEWTEDMKASFDAICGDTAKKWGMMMSKMKIEWLTKSKAMYDAFHSKNKPIEVRGGRIYELMAINVLKAVYEVSINKAFIKTNTIVKYSFQKQSKYVKADVCVVDPYIIALGKFSSQTKNIAVIHHINESLIGNKIISKLFYFNLYKNLKKMDAVVVVSEVWKNQLNKLGVKNVKIIYNAFDIETYDFSVQQQNAFKKKYNLSSTKPIVYLGPNSFGKGIGDVLKVIDTNKYELLATGKTEVNHKSVKTFFFSEEEFPLFLSCCNVVLCMSTMIEGWNRIAHEALLSKTPVIGSGSGGMQELLEKSGQIIVKDIHKLNEKIEYVLNNSNQFINLGHTYASKFDLNYFKSSWQTLIEEIK